MENRSFQRAGCPVEPFRSFLFSFTVRGILRLNNGISLGCQKRCITIRSRFQVERCLRAGRWWLKSMSASLLSVIADGKSLASFAQWRYSNQWSNREVLLLLVENYTQYPAPVRLTPDLRQFLKVSEETNKMAVQCELSLALNSQSVISVRRTLKVLLLFLLCHDFPHSTPTIIFVLLWHFYFSPN